MLKLVLYGGLNGLRRLAFQVLLETTSLAAVLVWFVVARDHLTLAVLFEILGVVNLVTAAVGFVPFVVYVIRATEGPRRAPTERTSRTGYMSYLGWAVGLSLVAIAFSDADRYLLAQVLSLELLAAFHIGARLGRLANRLLGVANLAFQPEVTRLDAEGRDGRVIQSTRIFLKFNSVFAVLMTALLVVFAREAIVIVSSEAYTTAVPLLVILALSLPLTTMTAPVTTVMKAVDQVHGALWCDLAWAACYVLLIFALAPAFGLVGVGFAQLVACAVQLVLALRLSKLPIGAIDVWSIAWKLAFAGGVAFLPAVVYGFIVENGSFYTTLGIKAVLFVVGVVVFRGLVRSSNLFHGDERTTLIGMLRSRRLEMIGRLVGV
jgi:O-antigen/teichoic acid export membrane protein